MIGTYNKEIRWLCRLRARFSLSRFKGDLLGLGGTEPTGKFCEGIVPFFK